MIDYRDELNFRITLVIFLVINTSKNNKGKMLLTIEKLRLMILICLTPKKLNRISNTLNNKNINYLKNILYDNSSETFYENDLKEISLLITYMCKEKYLKIIQEDTKFIIIGESASMFNDNISELMPLYLSRNLSLIKLISRKSESIITKSIMEL